MSNYLNLDRMKDYIVCSINYFGRTVVLRYSKTRVVEDYRQFVAHKMCLNQKVPFLKTILQKQIIEYLGEFVDSENKIHFINID
jgi:hypothetical protein